MCKKNWQVQQIILLQSRGRPQSNINKKENRYFFSIEAARRATWTKRKTVIFQNGSWGLSESKPQIEFWNIFYTILNYFRTYVSQGPSELPENFEIRFKSSQKRSNICRVGGRRRRPIEFACVAPILDTHDWKPFVIIALVNNGK